METARADAVSSPGHALQYRQQYQLCHNAQRAYARPLLNIDAGPALHAVSMDLKGGQHPPFFRHNPAGHFVRWAPDPTVPDDIRIRDSIFAAARSSKRLAKQSVEESSDSRGHRNGRSSRTGRRANFRDVSIEGPSQIDNRSLPVCGDSSAFKYQPSTGHTTVIKKSDVERVGLTTHRDSRDYLNDSMPLPRQTDLTVP